MKTTLSFKDTLIKDLENRFKQIYRSRWLEYLSKYELHWTNKGLDPYTKSPLTSKQRSMLGYSYQ